MKIQQKKQFSYYFWKVFAKNSALENNIRFLQQCFPIRREQESSRVPFSVAMCLSSVEECLLKSTKCAFENIPGEDPLYF